MTPSAYPHINTSEVTRYQGDLHVQARAQVIHEDIIASSPGHSHVFNVAQARKLHITFPSLNGQSHATHRK